MSVSNFKKGSFCLKFNEFYRFILFKIWNPIGDCRSYRIYSVRCQGWKRIGNYSGTASSSYLRFHQPRQSLKLGIKKFKTSVPCNKKLLFLKFLSICKYLWWKLWFWISGLCWNQYTTSLHWYTIYRCKSSVNGSLVAVRNGKDLRQK